MILLSMLLDFSRSPRQRKDGTANNLVTQILILPGKLRHQMLVLWHWSSHNRAAAIFSFAIHVSGKLMCAKDGSQQSGSQFRASVDLSRCDCFELACPATPQLSGTQERSCGRANAGPSSATFGFIGFHRSQPTCDVAE